VWRTCVSHSSCVTYSVWNFTTGVRTSIFGLGRLHNCE